jgi:anti-sigma B factor antagonist
VDINVRKRSQVQLIQLRGALRLGEPVDELRRTIDEALTVGDTRIVLNLAEVPMMDSSGIGVLMHFFAATKQRGGCLKLVQPSAYAAKTLRLVGVYNLFEVFDDDDAAVESFT